MQHGLFFKGVNLRNGLTAKVGTPNRSASAQGVHALACPEPMERLTGNVGILFIGLLKGGKKPHKIKIKKTIDYYCGSALVDCLVLRG